VSINLLYAIISIENPISYMISVNKNIILNGKDIFQNTLKIRKAYMNQQYFELGNEVGIVLKDVFIGSKKLESQTNTHV